MLSSIEYSLRTSEANRMADSQLGSSSNSRRMTLAKIDKDMSQWLFENSVRISPSAVDSLKELIMSGYKSGLRAGCLSGMIHELEKRSRK